MSRFRSIHRQRNRRQGSRAIRAALGWAGIVGGLHRNSAESDGADGVDAVNDLTKLPSFRTLDEWASGLRWLLAFKKNWQWIFGTHMIKGEDRFGEKVWNFIHPDEIHYSPGYLANIMSVCRQIGDQYTPEIPIWSFWEALAPMTPAARDPIITRALKNGANRDVVRALKAQTNGNGASEPENRSTRLETLKNDVASAYVTVGRLMQRGEDGPLLAAALDELIAAAMALREKLDGRRS